MSHKYIHEDLHRLVEKYFDSKKSHPIDTESYYRCNLSFDNILDYACEQYKNGNYTNIMRYLLVQTLDDKVKYVEIHNILNKEFEKMKISKHK